MDDNVIGIIVQVLTVAGGGFGLWYSIRNMTAAVEAKVDKLDEKFTGQIAALDKKFTGQIGALDKKFDAKIDKLGSDLRTEIATVRTEIGAVRSEVTSVRTELIARIDRVHEDLVDTRVHLSDRISRLEGAVLGHLTPHPHQIPLAPDRTS